MKWKLVVLAGMMIVMVSCGKDKFNTKPSLKLKSINSHVIPVNGILDLEFEFTDKEGDISNLLTVKKIRTNKRIVPTLRDSLSLVVPDIPKYYQGIIEAKLDYNNYLTSASNPPNTGNPPRLESDSLTLKFVLKDKGNNVSDTVTIENIVVQRQ